MKRKYLKGAAAKAAAAKAIKSSIDGDELMEKIKSAVKEAMGEEEAKGEEAGDEGGGASVEDIVAAVVDDIAEKRKSRKEAGEDVAELTEDDAAEIAEAVESILADVLPEDEGMKEDDDPDGEEKDDDTEDEEKDDEEAEAAKKKSRSAARQTKKRKASRPPVQRKYGNIYLQGGQGVTRTQRKEISPVVAIARAVKCIDVHGRHDPEAAAFYAKKLYGDDDMAREFKALNTVNPSAGGFLIPETYIDQIIELLYAKTVIFELGAQKVPMPNGSVNIPRMTSGTRARWGGEQRKIAATQPTFGNLKLYAKRLEAIVPQSRELMMSTTYSADQMFGNDLTRRMEMGLDFGALYGTGTEYQPLGICNHNDIQKIDVSKITDEAIVKAGMVTSDFPVYMRSQAMIKNIDDQHLGWTFNSLIEGYLMNLKTDTGTYIYREEMQSGKLLGSPYKISNQIPITDKGTPIIFGNWSDLIIGDQMGLETYTTLDGSWTDEEGVQHNAFEENLAATRALMYVDVGVRHTESFLVANNCMVPGIKAALAEIERIEKAQKGAQK